MRRYIGRHVIRRCAVLVALFLALGLVLAPPAWAQEENDEAADALVTRALKPDVAQPGPAGKAQALLQLAEKICAGGCSKPMQAKIHVAYGTVHAYRGKPGKAEAQFAKALELDPKAQLVAGRDGPAVKAAFEKAKAPKKPDKAEPEGEGKAPAAAEEPEEDKRLDKAECEKPETAAPKGWESPRAFCYFAEAVAAESAQEWRACHDYASRSLDDEPRLATRYLGAQCYERGGKWIVALEQYQEVVKLAMQAQKKKTAAEAQTRAKLLKERIPRVTLQPPADGEDITATIDGEDVTSKLGGEIWVNPGQHLIVAKGKVAGGQLSFRQTITIRESQSKTILITQGEGAIEDEAVRKCMMNAKTKEEIEACLDRAEGDAGVNLLVALELSGYHDSDAVDVVTPGLIASVESPTGGWGFGASFLVDVVTAASTDIVSTASPRWTEVRYVPAINAHQKIDDTDISVSGAASIEPDYLALSAGAGVSVEAAQKMVTPSLRYDFGYDVSGRAGTPFSVFSEKIHRHGATGSITFVVDKATIFVPTATAVFEFGDMSKPYRYMPLFAEGVTILPGETVDSVNEKRLPARIAEQLPEDRQRYALAGLFAHRFSDVTLRIEERLYIDSWGVKATTTDTVIPIDVTENVRIWPHLRFHAQMGADFYELAYVAQDQGNGVLNIPLLRTGDRELGPMITGTGGGGLRVDFGENDAIGVILTADAIYSRFLDHLFIRDRIAGFGALTLEVLFE